jgi:hypothetical protein
VYPVSDPLLLRKSGSAGNRTRDLWSCSQELWLVTYRGGTGSIYTGTECTNAKDVAGLVADSSQTEVTSNIYGNGGAWCSGGVYVTCTSTRCPNRRRLFSACCTKKLGHSQLYSSLKTTVSPAISRNVWLFVLSYTSLKSSCLSRRFRLQKKLLSFWRVFNELRISHGVPAPVVPLPIQDCMYIKPSLIRINWGLRSSGWGDDPD